MLLELENRSDTICGIEEEHKQSRQFFAAGWIETFLHVE